MANSVHAEQQLQSLDIRLPPPPKPLGSYVEAVRMGDMLHLSGMLPVVDGQPEMVGCVGAELSAEQGRKAAETACLNGLAVIRNQLGSLDRVTGIAKLGVYIATTRDFTRHAMVADGASDLLLRIFGRELLSGRIVLGVISLPLGVPVEVELLVQADFSPPSAV